MGFQGAHPMLYRASCPNGGQGPNPSTLEVLPEDHEFEDNLGYRMRSWFKKQTEPVKMAQGVKELATELTT